MNGNKRNQIKAIHSFRLFLYTNRYFISTLKKNEYIN